MICVGLLRQYISIFLSLSTLPCYLLSLLTAPFFLLGTHNGKLVEYIPFVGKIHFLIGVQVKMGTKYPATQ